MALIQLGNKIRNLLAPILVVIILIFSLSMLYFQQDKAEQGKVIIFGNNGYSPKYIKIHLGEKVTFKNESESVIWPASNLHPTHEIYPEFDSKKEILPGEIWTFIFDKSGRWSYHDHLKPNFIGIVEVFNNFATKNNKQPTKISDCNNISEDNKQQCWDELLTYTIKRKGLKKAFEVFSKIYNSNSEIPKVCHGWAHILGKEAYSLFRKNKKFILVEETSYCGYGFFHGFIEQLLQETGTLTDTKTFCEYAAEQLENSGDVYNNCIHGIGHGSVNVDNPELWGDFYAMSQSGLDKCDSILTNQHDLGSCYVGVFNAMTTNIWDDLYGIKLLDSDLYGYCRNLPEKYKDYCYYEFSGKLTLFAEYNFSKAVKLILSEDMNNETQLRSIGKMQGVWMQADIGKTTYKENLLNCRTLSNQFYEVCFEGILDGLLNNGDPGKEYVRAYAFCGEDVLTEKEKDRCIYYIIKRNEVSKKAMCALVSEEYQKYCQ